MTTQEFVQKYMRGLAKTLPSPATYDRPEQGGEVRELDPSSTVDDAMPDYEIAADVTDKSDGKIRGTDYSKGSFIWHGFHIVVESAAGDVRAGKDWQNLMQYHYGFIDGVDGSDGEGIDVFIGPDPTLPFVFVIDQVNPRTGKFDEHKVVIGVRDAVQATAIYRMAYDMDWQGLGPVNRLSIDNFKDWLRYADKKKPFSPSLDRPGPLSGNGGGLLMTDKLRRKGAIR